MQYWNFLKLKKSNAGLNFIIYDYSKAYNKLFVNIIWGINLFFFELKILLYVYFGNFKKNTDIK